MELGVWGHGRVSSSPPLSPVGRAAEASTLAAGEFGGSPEPLSSHPAAKGTSGRTGCPHLDTLLHAVHGGHVEEACGDDPVHGGASSHSAPVVL